MLGRDGGFSVHATILLFKPMIVCTFLSSVLISLLVHYMYPVSFNLINYDSMRHKSLLLVLTSDFL